MKNSTFGLLNGVLPGAFKLGPTFDDVVVDVVEVLFPGDVVLGIDDAFVFCAVLLDLGIPLISMGNDCTCTPAPGIKGKPNI